jgi:hypothetical protein
MCFIILKTFVHNNFVDNGNTLICGGSETVGKEPLDHLEKGRLESMLLRLIASDNSDNFAHSG